MNKQDIIKFLSGYKSLAIHIYCKKECQKMIANTGLEINLETDELEWNEKKVKLDVFYGRNDEPGYAMGMLIQAIANLLTGLELPPKICLFPNSIWYASEEQTRTDEAIQSVENLRGFLVSLFKFFLSPFFYTMGSLRSND